MSHVFVDWAHGLGDNIYLRPFMKALCSRAEKVWLSTPWPELWTDLPVSPVRPNSKLWTQQLSEERQASVFVPKPRGPSLTTLSPGYGTGEFRRGSLIDAIERAIPLDGAPFEMDLPELGRNPMWPVAADGGAGSRPRTAESKGRGTASARPLAIVRPVTIRMDWPNLARNPLPEYVDWIAGQLMATHHVVAVANLDARKELGLSIPPHHTDCMHGQLSTRQMLALVRDADIVVGGVGWIVPACIALKTRCFTVLGGNLMHNGPAAITDPRMDLSRLGWAWPDEPCARCEDPRHACRKTISDLEGQWSAFLSR